MLYVLKPVCTLTPKCPLQIMTRYVALIVNEHSAPEEVRHLCACEVDEVHVPVLKSTGHMIKLFQRRTLVVHPLILLQFPMTKSGVL